VATLFTNMRVQGRELSVFEIGVVLLLQLKSSVPMLYYPDRVSDV